MVGFATLRQSNVDSALCNGSVETFLSWTCDETKVWDPSVIDVTQYVKSDQPVVSQCLVSD